MNVSVKNRKKDSIGMKLGVYSAVNELSKRCHRQQLFNTSQGHGFAAEQINHEIDSLLQKQAKIVGGNNLKHGPDRLVNGIYYQTKYCQTPELTFRSLFKRGMYTYLNDGNPMVAEVPSDQYDRILELMKKAILDGKIPNVTNVSDAIKILRKGYCSYKQAVNVAKAGTVESLTYDSLTGMVTTASSMGVSAIISYGHSIWSGNSSEESLKIAAQTAIQTGMITISSHILTQQLGRTAYSRLLSRPCSSVAMALPKSTRVFLQRGIGIRSSNSITAVSKGLRTNLISSIALSTVLSTKDIVRLFNCEISAEQFGKNVVTTSAGVFSGSIGAWIGASALAPLGPFGMLVGSMIGGYAVGDRTARYVKKSLDSITPDDSVNIFKKINSSAIELAHTYLLTKEELNTLIHKLKSISWDKKIYKLYSSPSQGADIKRIISPFITEIVNEREYVSTRGLI